MHLFIWQIPEAIPLIRVDAVSVVEAMVVVFSRICVPYEMLTDQGSDGITFRNLLAKKLEDSITL